MDVHEYSMASFYDRCSLSVVRVENWPRNDEKPRTAKYQTYYDGL